MASVRSVSPWRSTWPLAPFAKVVCFLLLMSTLGVRIVSVASTAFVGGRRLPRLGCRCASAGAANATTHRAARPSDERGTSPLPLHQLEPLPLRLADVPASFLSCPAVTSAEGAKIPDPAGTTRHSRNSRLTPFNSTGPSGSTGGGDGTRLKTWSDRMISPRPAVEHSRAPTFTVSPTTSYWRRRRPPKCAATASPVLSPMPKATSGASRSSSSRLSSGVSSWIAIAHASACARVVVARDRRAPDREHLVAHVLHQRPAHREHELGDAVVVVVEHRSAPCPGGRLSDSAVKPRRSQNSTVMSRRWPSAAVSARSSSTRRCATVSGTYCEKARSPADAAASRRSSGARPRRGTRRRARRAGTRGW